MEIKPIEPIVKTQMSNNSNKHNEKFVKMMYLMKYDRYKLLGKTFEDYLNECMKSDKMIKVDEFTKLEESIPYINMDTENKDDTDYYINVARIKMAYGY